MRFNIGDRVSCGNINVLEYNPEGVVVDVRMVDGEQRISVRLDGESEVDEYDACDFDLED